MRRLGIHRDKIFEECEKGIPVGKQNGKFGGSRNASRGNET